MENCLILASLIIVGVGDYAIVMESHWIKDMVNYKCTDNHIYGIFRVYEDAIDKCAIILGRCIMFLFVVIVV